MHDLAADGLIFQTEALATRIGALERQVAEETAASVDDVARKQAALEQKHDQVAAAVNAFAAGAMPDVGHIMASMAEFEERVRRLTAARDACRRSVVYASDAVAASGSATSRERAVAALDARFGGATGSHDPLTAIKERTSTAALAESNRVLRSSSASHPLALRQACLNAKSAALSLRDRASTEASAASSSSAALQLACESMRRLAARAHAEAPDDQSSSSSAAASASSDGSSLSSQRVPSSVAATTAAAAVEAEQAASRARTLLGELAGTLSDRGTRAGEAAAEAEEAERTWVASRRKAEAVEERVRRLLGQQ